MANYKIQRLAADISQEISNIIANEANDSLLKTITITGCEVTNDLSFAKVYFTSLSNLTAEQLEKELKEAASYVRGELSKRIDVRHTPQLRFIFDKSIEYGNKIEKILEEIHEEE
ncbi:MAG: 30S ribosome-binding factor RbfA [Bacilli bacterium]|nr:30S ribosome-binding factor RbfA [Bacilli bacterium]MBQ9834136.1 30S ribosome-binding factor RbfA [Bacilli bacterium]